MKTGSLDLIVLTFNEEANLRHCLASAQGIARNEKNEKVSMLSVS